MMGIIEISTANLRFSTPLSSKKLSLGDSNNNRQPDMASEAGNIHISKTITDRFEISKENPGLFTMANSTKVSPSDCNNDGQHEVARLTPKTAILRQRTTTIAVLIVVPCRSHLGILSSSSPWSKIPEFSSEFQRYLL